MKLSANSLMILEDSFWQEENVSIIINANRRNAFSEETLQELSLIKSMVDARAEKLEKHVPSMKTVKLDMLVEESLPGLIGKYASPKPLQELSVILTMIA